ncbi:MAG: glycosyltransferase family 4 protein [Lachnospiraceae bacterium]|nr:glycosyltransferase family 4 protein [Lachnospiraceae bacterium]
MHIVFVTTELATDNNSSGGLATFTANMARIFVSHGHKVRILLATIKEQNLEFDDNIVLETVYVSKAVWDLCDRIAKACIWSKDSKALRRVFIQIYHSEQIKRKIKKIDDKEKIDIVHYCNLDSVAFRVNKSIPYLIRISGLGYTHRAANMYDCNIEYEDNELTANEKLLINTMKKSRFVISPSYKFADIVNRKFNIKPMIIESPFVLKKQDWNNVFFDQFMLGSKKYVIHYAAVLRYYKGTHVVAELAKELLGNHPDLYLVLAGGCSQMQDKSGNIMMAHELVKQNAGEYADRIIYVGKVVREQLYPLIQNAELCILPSRLENLPNACIEAMAMGKIVVATNEAGFEQLIDNGSNGFLCEKDNSESFLRGIESALSMSEEEKKLMESRAVETIKRLSPDSIYKQYLDFYEKVIREW